MFIKDFDGARIYFRVLTSNLPIYNSVTTLTKIGTLMKDQEYSAVSECRNWYKIQFDDDFGYVFKGNTIPSTCKNINNAHSSYKNTYNKVKMKKDVVVYDNSSGDLIAFGTIIKEQSYSIVSDFGNWWKIIFADRVGYIYKNATYKIITENVGAFETIKDASVSVIRDGQRVYVAKLNKGNIFKKEAIADKWLVIKYGNHTGYVWSEATDSVTSYFRDNEIIDKKITIVDSPVYESLNNKSPIATIHACEWVDVVNIVSKDWYEIELAGRNVFIRSINLIDLNSMMFSEVTHPYLDTLMKNLFHPSLVQDKIIEAANLILNDKISFPKYNKGFPMDYTNGVNWIKGENVEVEHQRSFLRQLHGLLFINDLSEAYYLTSNEETKKEYIIKGYQYIKEWIQNNPYHNPMHSMAWHDETTARRLSTLVKFFDAGKYILSKHQQFEIFISMAFHAKLLMDEQFHAKNTNHGMFQDEALIVFSKYFYKFKPFKSYYITAVNRLKEYIETIISKDGVHLEHSPAYHQIIAISLKSYGQAFRELDEDSIANYFLKRYNEMVHFATHIIKPDGKFPLLADTYETDNPPNHNLWQNSLHYQYAVTKGELGEKPSITDAVFMNSGYAIFRNQWSTRGKGTYVLFIAAYHTKYHKHSDDLSIWIYNNGDIITEAGPHSYDLTHPVTQYAYSSYGHNTLIVDNNGLPRIDGKYNSTFIESFNIDDESRPTVTGVNKRFNGITHRRKVVYDKNIDVIEVNDTVLSNDFRNYKLLWHLAPDIIPHFSHRKNEIMLSKNGEEVAAISVLSDVRVNMFSVYGDEDKKFKSWTFNNNRDNAIIDVHTVIFEFDGIQGKVQTNIKLLN